MQARKQVLIIEVFFSVMICDFIITVISFYTAATHGRGVNTEVDFK